MSSTRAPKRVRPSANEINKRVKEATLKDVYALAESYKTEDRLTDRDVAQAKKVLNYEDAAPEIKAEGAKKGKMIKKYSYGGAAIKGTKFKGVF